MVWKLLSRIKILSKISKKLIVKSVFLFLILFSFVPHSSFGSLQVHATTDKASGGSVDEKITAKENLISWNNFLQVLSSMAYVLLWPLIALAGLAMDNQLIYGSFMQLDVSLWNIWQIVRNFANYALGLVFLVWILMYNFSPGGKIWFWSFMKGISGPKDLITKTLIAGVIIQASWFILMAMVDLSTILTYSVGAIPTTIVGKGDTKWDFDSRILGMNTLLNLWDAWVQKDVDQAIISYRSTSITGEKIAPCKVVKAGWDQTFVIGRAFDELVINGKKVGMASSYCVHFWALISFSEFSIDTSEKNFSLKMKKFADDVKTSTSDDLKKFVNWWMIFPVTRWKISVEYDENWNTQTTQESVEIGSGDNKRTYESTKLGCEGVFGTVSSKKQKDWSYQCLYKETNLSISTLIEKSKSMTGPFASLYSNVLQFSDLTWHNKDLWDWQLFIIAIINAGFSVLLLLPLVALVIVLVARIGVLWIAIATSPFIVLINVFKDMFPKDLLPEWLSLSELIKLLIAPVLIAFAVSLSLVFMQTLKWTLGSEVHFDDAHISNWELAEQKDIIKEISGFNVDGSGNLEILDFVKIQIDNGLLNLSWIITMLFGLGITWFLLFWAIKQTKLWKSIGGSLQKFWERTLSSLPVIPIWKKGISFGALTQAPGRIWNDIASSLEREANDNLNALFDPKKAEEKANAEAKAEDEKKFNDNAKTFFTSTSTTPQSFHSAFGIQQWDTQKFLNTYEKSNSYLENYTFDTADQKNKAEERLKQEAKSEWDALITKAQASTEDPENQDTEISKVKNSLEAMIGNQNIQSSGIISDWIGSGTTSKDLKIWQKTYELKKDWTNKFLLTLKP